MVLQGKYDTLIPLGTGNETIIIYSLSVAQGKVSSFPFFPFNHIVLNQAPSLE